MASAFKGNTSHKRKLKDEFEKKLKKPEARDMWKTTELLPWEDRKRQSCRGGKKARIEPNADCDVTLNDEQGLRYEQIAPVFWPVDIWTKWHTGEVHPDALEKLDFKGRQLEGVWQDWDGNSPLPTGVICVVCSDVCWDIICVVMCDCVCSEGSLMSVGISSVYSS